MAHDTSPPISAERKRSTFLGLPEKLTGTGRPPGDSTTKESLEAAGRERLPWIGSTKALLCQRAWVPQRFPPAVMAHWRLGEKTERGALRWDGTRGEGCYHRHGAHGASEPTRVLTGLGDPVTWCLVGTGRRDGGWVCREFQMAEDFANHRALRDDGDEPQHSALAKGTRSHIHVEHPLEQSRPTPARRRGACLRLVKALLPWRREDRPTQMAVRRQAAAIPYQVDVGQGHQGRQFLQEFQRRECDARGAVRPRVGERVDQIAVGVLRQPLQRHGAT